MINNVIFDLGSVLINNDPSEYIKSLGYSEEKTETLNQALSSDTIWHDKDMGIYESYVDCIPIFQRKHPEFTEEILMFFQDGWMSKIYHPIEENMILYERAKELGYSIYLLTNYSVDGFAYLETNYDFIREVNGKIVSSHVHLCKPDKRIYELLLDKYDLKASECIFFDDNPANVLAAEELGIQGVLFTDIEEATKILDQSQKQF
jgi:HAD superfamily hydrolase (TIGR01509 family)